MDYGNPGAEYEYTRHNAGFMAIDYIARKLQIDVNKSKFDALIGEGRYKDEKIILAKPQTYMNLSGESIIQIMNFYKLNDEDLIVIYDDIDIELGSIRIRPSGSAGTHNGMRNIVQMLGSEDFARIRIGTGKTPEYMDLKDFVLMKMNNDEKDIIENVLDFVYNALIEILNNGVHSAMNLYNKTLK